MVGAAGFEPATSWSQTMRASQLCHAPGIIHFKLINPIKLLTPVNYRISNDSYIPSFPSVNLSL